MSKKTVNSDIYNLSSLVDAVKRFYIPNENEETLAIGTYGYIGALESMRLQTQVEMTGELANEAFPARARLERNIITHAITAGIDDINAVPSTMPVFIGIKEKDIANNISADSNVFVIDRECPFYFGDFEFHLEYDIKLHRVLVGGPDSGESGSKYVYSAEYDISDQTYNPISNITSSNRYLSSPAIVNVSNENYVYVTANIRQVVHNSTFKKLVTSNIADNKIINFNFDDQLAYFQVFCKTSGEELIPITPVFEGGAPEEGTAYYCWYQYIDTNLIRIRFDRQSYMPTLNTEIEVKYKTTLGEEGNFKYNDQVMATLASTKYGYKSINVLISPLGNAINGKNRKSKEELRALIPKETFARGSLTTITDLNNYFSTLDTNIGRIIVQKKIDNQLERVYYAYMVAKDSSGNVIPANTIDLKIGMEDLIDSGAAESAYPCYILKAGKCIKLVKEGDRYIGIINHDPIVDTEQVINAKALERGKMITAHFKAKVTDDSVPMRVYALVDGLSTALVDIPGSGTVVPVDDAPEEMVEDYMLAGCGRKYAIKGKFISKGKSEDGYELTVECGSNYGADVIFVGAEYTLSNEEGTVFPSFTPRFTINPGLEEGTEVEVTYHFKISNMADNSYKVTPSIKFADTEENEEVVSNIMYVPVITSTYTSAQSVNVGDVFEFTLNYVSPSSKFAPKIEYIFSRGIEYVALSNTMYYQGEEAKQIEPVEEDMLDKAGFLYTNPYSVNINRYHLYSAFYMMAVNENPFLHFIYVNDDSNYQFIATNLTWKRPFLEGDSDTYHLRIVIQQTIQDISLQLKEDEVKCIAVFYRDDKPYRYKTLKCVDIDTSKYTYTFEKDFYAKDILDNDNNIRADNFCSVGQGEVNNVNMRYGTIEKSFPVDSVMELEEFMDQFGIKQDDEEYVAYESSDESKLLIYADVEEEKYYVAFRSEFVGEESLTIITTNDAEETKRYTLFAKCNLDYGFFPASTDLVLYTLVNKYKTPEEKEKFNRDDLDAIVPGLEDWNLTNKYKVVNGVSFYYNYSEIMGSRVIPYGDTVSESLNPDGYYVNGVPVFGYDYCQDPILVNSAIDSINTRKAYIDNILEVLENSFGIDFKTFNSYGPSKTYYIVRDENIDGNLNDRKEYIDRVDIKLYFRLKLTSKNDSYTKSNIIADVKEYIEDLDDLTDLHIPNLVTQITNSYKEQIAYFEYIGFNDYGPDVQHIYKDSDNTIDIHTPPEFINVRNFLSPDGTLTPNVSVYISDI